MKSVRLNTSARDAIKAAMLEAFAANYFVDTFGDYTALLAAIEEQRIAVMKTLWNRLYADYKLALESVPEFLVSGASFTVAKESSTIVESMQEVGFPGKRTSGADMVLPEAEFDLLFEKVTTLRGLRTTYQTDFNKAQTDISAILDAVTSTGQLVDVWPAAEAFIPASLKNPQEGIKLPIPSPEALNVKLGVPS